MPMIAKKRALLAKIEVTYGTDPTPTGAANAVLIKNPQIRPQQNRYAERRDIAMPFLGGFAALTANTFVEIDFDVEVSGGGAAGTAPPYGVLLRACALAETINVAVDVQYAPISSGFESATIYWNEDGLLHKITGCRGAVTLNMQNEEIPTLHFTMVGLYNAPTDTALPSLTLTAWQTPLPMNKTNTTPITLHGYACGLWAASVELANEVPYVSFPGGSEQVFVVDRKPAGSVTIEHPTIAQKDYYAICKSGATGALSVTHGTAAGNKFKVDANQARLTNPAKGNQNGIVTLSMGLDLALSVAGNDELKFTVS